MDVQTAQYLLLKRANNGSSLPPLHQIVLQWLPNDRAAQHSEIPSLLAFVIKYINIVDDYLPHNVLMNIRNASYYFLTLLQTPPDKHSFMMGLYYGNNGGPFHHGNNFPHDAVDALDVACYFHDRGLHRTKFQELVQMIKEHFGSVASPDAIEYMDAIQGWAFTIVEPIYMNTIGKILSLFGR